MQKRTLVQLSGGQWPKMVIFDLDGTLVDSVPDLAFAIDEMLCELDVSVAGETLIREWVGNGAAKLVERALVYAGLPHNEFSVSASVERFKHFYRSHCSVDTCLYDGVFECLQTLHQQNVLMAVVTNKPREFVPGILDALKISHFFVSILGGDDLPQKKPSPEPLLYCLQQQGVRVDQAVMIGDSRNDIVAAREAGISVVAVDYGYNHGNPIEAECPDIVVSSLMELM